MMSQNREYSHNELNRLCTDDFIDYFRYLMENNQGSEKKDDYLWAIHSGAKAYNAIFTLPNIKNSSKDDFINSLNSSLKFFTDKDCAVNAYFVEDDMKDNKDMIINEMVKLGWVKFDPITNMYKIMDNFVPIEIDYPEGYTIEDANEGLNKEEFCRIVPSAFLDNPYERDYIDDVSRVLKCYRCPRWLLYVGKLNGVITSTISIHVKDDYGSIHMVVTKEEFRRRGYASLLLNYSLNKVHELGIKYCILQSEPNAVKVYEKIGFIPCGDMIVLAPPQSRCN